MLTCRPSLRLLLESFMDECLWKSYLVILLVLLSLQLVSLGDGEILEVLFANVAEWPE